MPSIVHTTNQLINGLAVVSDSASESASGLVRAQIEYVHRTANIARLNKLFYVDAPPPVFPKSVNANELINRRLYMVQRSVEQRNGLTHVQAEYVGGFANKPNNYGRFIDRESERSFSFSQRRQFTLVNPDPSEPSPTQEGTFFFTDFYAYSYIPFVHTFEYAEVGNVASYRVVPPSIEMLFELSTFRGEFYERAPERGWGGIKAVPYEKEFFVNQIVSENTIKDDRRAIYETPTVKTIQHRYYF
jgi:hypothetical protein